MNSFSLISFLGGMSVVGLLMFILARGMDGLAVSTKEKIFLLRSGIVLFLFSFPTFLILRTLSWRSVEIRVPPPVLLVGAPSSNGSSAVHFQTSFLTYAVLLYAVVLTVLIFRLLMSYIRARRALAGAVRTNLLGREIFLHVSLRAPVTFGFFHPRIYFPADVEGNWTLREIEMALTHEEVHLSRNDQWWKLGSLIARALFFFAPWFWLLHKKLDLETEIFCDSESCRRAKASVAEYGQLLLDLVCGNRFSIELVTSMTDSTLKRRILAMRSRTTQRPLLVTAVGILFLMAGSGAVAITGGVTQRKTPLKIEGKVFIEGKLISSPTVITVAGETAQITMQQDGPGVFMNLLVLPTEIQMEDGTPAVKVEMDLSYSQGSRRVHSKPIVSVSYGEKASIAVAGEDGEDFEVEMVVRKQESSEGS